METAATGGQATDCNAPGAGCGQANRRSLDLNWVTAGTNLCRVPNSELDAAMPTLLPKTLKVVPAPLIEVVPRAPPELELPNPRVVFTCGTWCRPDTCGRRKRLSSRGPLHLLRLVQFDRRLTHSTRTPQLDRCRCLFRRAFRTAPQCFCLARGTCGL